MVVEKPDFHLFPGEAENLVDVRDFLILFISFYMIKDVRRNIVQELPVVTDKMGCIKRFNLVPRIPPYNYFIYIGNSDSCFT